MALSRLLPGSVCLSALPMIEGWHFCFYALSIKINAKVGGSIMKPKQISPFWALIFSQSRTHNKWFAVVIGLTNTASFYDNRMLSLLVNAWVVMCNMFAQASECCQCPVCWNWCIAVDIKCSDYPDVLGSSSAPLWNYTSHHTQVCAKGLIYIANPVVSVWVVRC